MATYIKIASNTVGAGGAASVTFSSIPATYTDLLIDVSARSNTGAAFAGLVIAFNGSSANYTLKWLGDAGGGVVSYSQGTFGYNHVFYIAGNGATASTFSNGAIYLPNYASSNFKSLSADGANENNAAGVYQGISAGLWSSTAAINQLGFSTGGNFMQHTTFTLYGISNA